MKVTINGKSQELIEIQEIKDEILEIKNTVNGLGSDAETTIDFPSSIEKPGTDSSKQILIKFLNRVSPGLGMSDLTSLPTITIKDTAGAAVVNGLAGTTGGTPISELSMVRDERGIYSFILDIVDTAGVLNIPKGSYSLEIRADYGTIGTPIVDVFAKSFEVVDLTGIAGGFDNLEQVVTDNKGLKEILSSVELMPFVAEEVVLTSDPSSMGASGNTTSDTDEVLFSHEFSLPNITSFEDSSVLMSTVYYSLDWQSVMDSNIGITKWMISPDGTLTGAIALTEEVISSDMSVTHHREGEFKSSLQGSNWHLILVGRSVNSGDVLTADALSSTRIKFTCKTFTV